VRRLLDSVTASAGPIDIVVNVAGVLSISSVADLTVQEWDRIMNVNACGTFLVSASKFAIFR
jgi:meso-butanediol dehydrogenase/(S,S)-butanediol dehydrogenase/diacetyl reductase